MSMQSYQTLMHHLIINPLLEGNIPHNKENNYPQLILN
jgi:hypothetical protein